VKNEEHYYTEPAYSLNDIADWYLLSLGQTIVGFPTSSSYSSSAHCRGGSVIHYVGTESEFTETVYKVLSVADDDESSIGRRRRTSRRRRHERENVPKEKGIRSPSEIAAVKMRVLLTSELVQNYQRSTF